MKEKYQAMADYLNDVNDFNFHNGIKITDIDDDHAECRVELTQQSMNSEGIVHGGLIFALCDVATGFALCADDRPSVTSGSSMNFLRPATGTSLRAVGQIIKSGKRISVVEGRVFDDRDRLIAVGTFEHFFVD